MRLSDPRETLARRHKVVPDAIEDVLRRWTRLTRWDLPRMMRSTEILLPLAMRTEWEGGAQCEETKKGEEPAKRPGRDLVSAPSVMGCGILRGVWASSVPLLRPKFNTPLSTASERPLIDGKVLCDANL